MILTTETNLITKPFNNDPTNRWLPNLTNAQHHGMKAITATKIKDWLKMSDKVWHYNHVMGKKSSSEVSEIQRKAYAQGTLIHMAVLEPDVFETSVIVNDMNQSTKEFKDYINETFGKFVPDLNAFPSLPESKENDVTIDGLVIPEVVPSESKKTKKKEVNNNGTWHVTRGSNGQYYKDGKEIYVVKSSEMAMYRQIQTNVKNHKLASKLLSNGVAELSGVARDPETGLYMNIRGDWKGDGFFIDVKSTGSCSLQDIKYAIETYNYPIQHVHYLETANLIDGKNSYEHFAYMFISKDAPYEIVLVKLDSDAIRKASKFRRDALRRIAECQNSNVWDSEVNFESCFTLELSNWYGNKFKK